MATDDQWEEGVTSDNEWMAYKPKPKPSLFAYDWSHGYISPFRATPAGAISSLISSLDSHGIIPRAFWRDKVVYDLGCGDGSLLLELAQEAAIIGRGIDLDSKLISQAIESSTSIGLQDKLTFTIEDIRQTSVVDADVIFVYLLPSALVALEAFLQKVLESKPSTILISEQWPINYLDNLQLYVHNDGQFRVYRKASP